MVVVSKKKFRKHRGIQNTIRLVLSLILIAFLCNLFKLHNMHAKIQTIEEKEDNSAEVEVLNLTKYEQCSLVQESSSTRPKEEWSKPIWFAFYPASISESTHKQMINKITGLNQGGKSFYASVRNKLRQCVGETETATCSTIHPVIPMNGGPDKKADGFYSKIILVLRNPKTVFPAHLNEKAIKYGGQEGQVPIEKWRESRDTWLEGMMEEWANFIKEWSETKSYKKGFYLVYEDLMDFRRGSSVITGIARLLDEAGFNIVVDDQKMPCVWYDSIGSQNIKQYYETQYEYKDYIPGYTKKQQEMMMSHLSDLMRYFSEDKDLLTILEKYHDDIKENTNIDTL